MQQEMVLFHCNLIVSQLRLYFFQGLNMQRIRLIPNKHTNRADKTLLSLNLLRNSSFLRLHAIVKGRGHKSFGLQHGNNDYCTLYNRI